MSYQLGAATYASPRVATRQDASVSAGCLHDLLDCLLASGRNVALPKQL